MVSYRQNKIPSLKEAKGKILNLNKKLCMIIQCDNMYERNLSMHFGKEVIKSGFF